MKLKTRLLRLVAIGLILLMAVPPGTFAQETAAGNAAIFKQEELDQLLAPVALYPDSLLAQVLMASTYPLEVTQAARWIKANKTLKDDALEAALEDKKWDPSVKSLIPFPDVLSMMDDKLEWTEKLGDAFLAQQGDVMESVQRLRAKAYEAGQLNTTKEQKVIVEKTVETQIIRVEPATTVVYVPVYNPTVVYGVWAYPAYPPYYYYPPGYVATTSVFSFAAGVAVGAAWYGGFHWGHSHHHHDTKITVNHNYNYNRPTSPNRPPHQRPGDGTRPGGGNRPGDRPGGGNRPGGGEPGKPTHYAGEGNKADWKHNPEHRKGVSYRDQATAQKYDRAASADKVKARENFRGRAESGRRDISRGGADQFKGRDVPARGGTAGPDRMQSRDTNRAGSAGRGSAFSGMDRGGKSTRDISSRGSSSRQSMSSGSRGGGSRGGGGGGRGGSRGGGSRGGRR